ncbi:unnamed protein product [Diatraea saccharalis]|uniref:Uncharacterized protein n=1 Tax=Diatraea saccharalis TaxID=40085 RepID=A0A9N9RD50_9NEOP|nr:unnamed protein product [Diatraea saccharalis]
MQNITDANDLHRARDIKTARNLEKPMFVQTDLRLARNDIFPNVTATTLPEFKPISDEQIEKVSRILKEMSKKRTGRLLDSSAQEAQIKANVLKKFSQKADRQDEKKCPQGGTCEFFFYCWMVGGLLEGSCGGLLKGCCHRVAKAGILGVQDSNSIDYGPSAGLSYGPVINDESKFYAS